MGNKREQEKIILNKILDQRVYDARIRPSALNDTGEKNINGLK